MTESKTRQQRFLRFFSFLNLLTILIFSEQFRIILWTRIIVVYPKPIQLIRTKSSRELTHPRETHTLSCSYYSSSRHIQIFLTNHLVHYLGPCIALSPYLLFTTSFTILNICNLHSFNQSTYCTYQNSEAHLLCIWSYHHIQENTTLTLNINSGNKE